MIIDEEEYKRLIDRDKKLTALEYGGVDSWEWYEASLTKYFKEKAREEIKEKVREIVSDEWKNIIVVLAKGLYESPNSNTGYSFIKEYADKAEEIFIDAILKYEEKVTNGN